MSTHRVFLSVIWVSFLAQAQCALSVPPRCRLTVSRGRLTPCSRPRLPLNNKPAFHVIWTRKELCYLESSGGCENVNVRVVVDIVRSCHGDSCRWCGPTHMARASSGRDQNKALGWPGGGRRGREKVWEPPLKWARNASVSRICKSRNNFAEGAQLWYSNLQTCLRHAVFCCVVSFCKMSVGFSLVAVFLSLLKLGRFFIRLLAILSLWTPPCISHVYMIKGSLLYSFGP